MSFVAVTSALSALLVAFQATSYEGSCSLMNTWNSEFRNAMIGNWRSAGTEERRYAGYRKYYESGRTASCPTCCVETRTYDITIRVEPPSAKGFVRQLPGTITGSGRIVRGPRTDLRQENSYINCAGESETFSYSDDVVVNFKPGAQSGGPEAQCSVAVNYTDLSDGSETGLEILAPTAIKRPGSGGWPDRIYRKR